MLLKLHEFTKNEFKVAAQMLSLETSSKHVLNLRHSLISHPAAAKCSKKRPGCALLSHLQARIQKPAYATTQDTVHIHIQLFKNVFYGAQMKDHQ